MIGLRFRSSLRRSRGKRLLLNSACVGYLDCSGDGTFGGGGSGDGDSPTSLEVLRFMAKQRHGPPKIVDCGVTQCC